MSSASFDPRFEALAYTVISCGMQGLCRNSMARNGLARLRFQPLPCTSHTLARGVYYNVSDQELASYSISNPPPGFSHLDRSFRTSKSSEAWRTWLETNTGHANAPCTLQRIAHEREVK